MGRSIIAFPFLLIPLSSICSPDSTYVCTARYHKIFILFVLCIVLVCFNGASARFSQRRPIPVENGNLSMAENLVMTSAYALCLSTQTLRVGLKKLSRDREGSLRHMCCCSFRRKINYFMNNQRSCSSKDLV